MSCTGWEWLVLALTFGGGWIGGMILMSTFSTQAYDTGYEDALEDHGIRE